LDIKDSIRGLPFDLNAICNKLLVLTKINSKLQEDFRKKELFKNQLELSHKLKKEFYLLYLLFSKSIPFIIYS
jgi:hypothetical protein